MDKNLKICIIGAGPAGLSAAETLKDLGYKNITLLEKTNKVGGQALSKIYRTPDNREIIYELGSLQPIATGVGYQHTLMKRYDLHVGRTLTLKKPAYFRLYEVDKHQVVLDFSKYKLGRPFSFKFFLTMLSDVTKLLKSLFRYRKLAKPGFLHISKQQTEELSIPFEQWVDMQNFRLIGKDLKLQLGSMLTFSNAGLKEKMPAIKFTKFLLELMKFPPRYIDGSYKPMREGFQELWKRVAKNHSVKLDTQIKKITRDPQKISVELENETLSFDKLILACAFNEMTNVLDLTPTEQEIFSKIHYCYGWRAAFTAKNLPTDAAYFLDKPYLDKTKPMLAAFLPEGQIDKDTWLFGSVITTDNKITIEELLANTEKFLHQEFGTTDIHWLETVYWPTYAPFFESEDVKAGIYTKLEALQNTQNTFYLGDILGGGTHSIVSNYAHHTIKKYFK